jgi:hypothetical protein
LNAQAALPSPCRASITSNVLSIFGRFQYDRIYLPSIEYPVWIETPHASTVWLVVWVLSVSSWMQSWGIEPFSMCVTFLSTPAYFLLVFFLQTRRRVVYYYIKKTGFVLKMTLQVNG